MSLTALAAKDAKEKQKGREGEFVLEFQMGNPGAALKS
jgi:hypothetical protein